MEDGLPISSLQHYIYCPRQCALIHVERLWADNIHTASGSIEHERVDAGQGNTSRGIRIERSVHLLSELYGMQGVADVVEYHGPRGRYDRIVPVEYKHGKPKAHRADEVQLCAQAICLEEMHGMDIERGYLFYLKPRRRTDVLFDEELRNLTIRTILDVRSLIDNGETPPARYEKSCEQCSMIDLCLPHLGPHMKGIGKVPASQYNDRQFSLLLNNEPSEP